MVPAIHYSTSVEASQRSHCPKGHTCLNNLRPVALTDTFVKVVEHFIVKCVLSSMMPKLDPAHFGNLKSTCMTHCLIDVLLEIYAHTEKCGMALQSMPILMQMTKY